MEIDGNQLEFTLSKIAKPSYRQIRTALKSYSGRFNHLQDDSDLKKMSSTLALELVHWFNEEAFGISRESLLDNYDAQFYAQEGLPVAEKVEQCVALINSNLLAYKGLAMINQHLRFHFNLILNPELYSNEWKLVLQQMLDFLEFKSQMAPRHATQIAKLTQKKQDLDEARAQLQVEIDKLGQLKLAKEQNQEIAEEQQRETEALEKQFGVLQPQLDQLTEELREKEQARDALLESNKVIEEQTRQICAKIETTRALKVTVDPIEVANAREEAAQVLKQREENLAAKKKQLNQVQQRNQQLAKLVQERRAHLEFIKSAQQLKAKKKKEKEQVLEGRRQLEQLRCAIQLSRQDVASLQTIYKSQEQQDRQFQDYHRQKIDGLRERLQDGQRNLEQKVVERDAMEKQVQSERAELSKQIAQASSEMQTQDEQLMNLAQCHQRLSQGLFQFNEQVKEKLFEMPNLNPHENSF